MEWYSWFFDGIGTSIVSAIIGLVLGGIGGFAIGRKSKSKQIQKAKNDAIQQQSVNVDDEIVDSKKSTGTETTVVQKQTAKNNAQQIQIGSVKNGK